MLNCEKQCYDLKREKKKQAMMGCPTWTPIFHTFKFRVWS